MFIGHYAVALGARRYLAPVSLGTLFLACQLADLIWPNLVLLGIEKVEIDPGNTALTPLDFIAYPWSHSLVALSLWAFLLAGIYVTLTRVSVKIAVGLALVVFSHWVLDVLSHGPDMPLTIGGSARIGLGLWNHPVAGIAVESLLFAGGVRLYTQSTKPTDRTGSIGFWALIGFLSLVYVANLTGPPPPSATAVAWSAQAMWLLVAWGYWVDRHRTPRLGG